jgi:hypothetical protein
MTVEADLAQGAVATLGAGYTYGVNMLTGPVRKPSDNQALATAVPHKAAFFNSTGGITSVPFLDGGSKTEEERLTVQIWIRSKPGDYDDGKAFAQAIFNAVDMTPPTGYFECRAMNSAPMYVGLDQTDHHVWSVNVLMNRMVGV